MLRLTADPTLSIIVPLRDGDELTEGCRRGLTLNRAFDPDRELIMECGGNAKGLQAAALNRGIRKATGRYVIMLGADTEAFAGIFDQLIDHLIAHPEAAYAYCGYRRSGKLSGVCPGQTFDLDKLSWGNYIWTSAVCHRQDLLDVPLNESPEVERLLDWEQWRRLAIRGRFGVWLDTIGFDTSFKDGDISLRDDADYAAAVDAVNLAVDAERKSCP